MSSEGGTTPSSSSSSTDSSSSDSGETGETGEEGEEGTNDPCLALDCGSGRCVLSDLELPTCECDPGYIHETMGDTASSCVLDESCIEVRTLECRSSVPEGSAVGMLFSVSYCNGEPYLDLPISDLIVEEKQDTPEWEELLPSESSQTFIDQEFTHHVYVLIDVSDSIKDSAGALETLETAISGFLDQLNAQTTPIRFSAYLFDGGISLYEFVPDTGNFSAAKTTLDSLASESGDDSASTNLYGAIIEGIEEVEEIQNNRKLASDRGIVTAGTVIVVSDGDDEAGRATLEQVQARIDLTKANVITVGYGEEDNYPTLLSLGRDGAFSAGNNQRLIEVFDELGTRMGDFARSVYFLGYCSPKRGGEAQVRARIEGATTDASIVSEALCDIDATFFDDGCSSDTFVPATACAARDCGGLVGCGTCSAGNCCVEGQCQGVSTRGILELDATGCNSHLDCVAGLTCNNGVCVTPVDIDQGCGTCELGVSFCNDSNVCEAVKPIGQACTSPAECASLHCTYDATSPTDPNQYCFPAPGFGDPCSLSCADGNYCTGNPSVCDTDLYRYEQCGAGEQCRSGYCRGFAADTFACDSVGECFFDSPVTG